MRRLVLLAAACLCAAVLSPAAASATAGCDAGAPNQVTWTGAAGDHLWTTAGNWSPGLPDGTSYVCIPAGADTITISGPAAAASMEAHRPLRVNGPGALLELSSTTDPSTTTKIFKLSSGELGGQGTLQVASGGTLA